LNQIHLRRGHQQEPAIEAIKHEYKLKESSIRDFKLKEEKTKVLPPEEGIK
jgi:hypothetical protein